MTISKLYAAVLNAFFNKRGAAMVEYALLAGLIAVVAMGTIASLGSKVNTMFSSINTQL